MTPLMIPEEIAKKLEGMTEEEQVRLIEAAEKSNQQLDAGDTAGAEVTLKGLFLSQGNTDEGALKKARECIAMHPVAKAVAALHKAMEEARQAMQGRDTIPANLIN